MSEFTFILVQSRGFSMKLKLWYWVIIMDGYQEQEDLFCNVYSDREVFV